MDYEEALTRFAKARRKVLREDKSMYGRDREGRWIVHTRDETLRIRPPTVRNNARSYLSERAHARWTQQEAAVLDILATVEDPQHLLGHLERHFEKADVWKGEFLHDESLLETLRSKGSMVQDLQKLETAMREKEASLAKIAAQEHPTREDARQALELMGQLRAIDPILHLTREKALHQPVIVSPAVIEDSAKLTRTDLWWNAP
jgi:hypothetical protein